MELIMQRFIWLLIALLTFAPAAQSTVDDPVITLTSPAGVASRRAALINVMYGIGTLPTTQAVVTQGVSNPYGGTLPNVARVDQYVASMSNNQSNTSLLYIANSPSNRRVVTVNMGHQETCSWPSFAAGYGTTQLLTAVLSAGYSVFAMNMPACGDVGSHNALFSSYGSTAMQYFVEPVVQAMNYWDAHNSFSRYDYAGLSGGGWTGAVLAAIDPRVTASIPVAGSMPGIEFSCQPGNGDAEQKFAPFYTIAGYLDLYLMGASGANRRVVQILNVGDDCCFGPVQWNAANCQATYSGQDWFHYLPYYWNHLVTGAASTTIAPYRYEVKMDFTSCQ